MQLLISTITPIKYPGEINVNANDRPVSSTVSANTTGINLILKLMANYKPITNSIDDVEGDPQPPKPSDQENTDVQSESFIKEFTINNNNKTFKLSDSSTALSDQGNCFTQM